MLTNALPSSRISPQPLHGYLMSGVSEYWYLHTVLSLHDLLFGHWRVQVWTLHLHVCHVRLDSDARAPQIVLRPAHQVSLDPSLTAVKMEESGRRQSHRRNGGRAGYACVFRLRVDCPKPRDVLVDLQSPAPARPFTRTPRNQCSPKTTDSQRLPRTHNSTQ